MGVRGLESYVENLCDVFYSVDILKMATEDAVQKNRRPILVIDLMSCSRKFYVEIAGLDVVCGGQHAEYLDFLRSFVDRFRSAGIDLVFVNDGPSMTAKRDTWVRRRYETWDRFVRVCFDALKATQFPKFSDQGGVSLPGLQGRDSPIVKHYSKTKNPCFVSCV
jgi:hypothetical protein